MVHIITNQKVSFRCWKREFVVLAMEHAQLMRQNPTEYARETKTVRRKPKLNMLGKPNKEMV